MIEMPEATNLSKQLNETIPGKVIKSVRVNQSPHKFAWFYQEPEKYEAQLIGKKIGTAFPRSGMVEIQVEDMRLLFGDGINLRYFGPADPKPVKHQMCVVFEDESALVASVQMYGGLWCFQDGNFSNEYYQLAKGAKSILLDEFAQEDFRQMIDLPDYQKLSVKAFLATQQRIPGLGNGVLQDILYSAKLHPKRKIGQLSIVEKQQLFRCVQQVLKEMAELGGRDTEKDLFGNAGGYVTKMSKQTVGKPCPLCGETIVKEAYMGGSVYYCPGCQKL